MNHKTKVSEGVLIAVREYLNVNSKDNILWYLELDEAGERCCRVYGRHPKSTPPVETSKENKRRYVPKRRYLPHM